MYKNVNCRFLVEQENSCSEVALCGAAVSSGQLLPLVTLTGSSKLAFGFCSCNEGFINREINWLIRVNNGVRVVCSGCGLCFNCLSLEGEK